MRTAGYPPQARDGRLAPLHLAALEARPSVSNAGPAVARFVVDDIGDGVFLISAEAVPPDYLPAKQVDFLLEGVEFELSGDSLSVSKPCKSVKKS